MDKETPPSVAMGMVNLASPRMGTKIHSVSDDFFAEAPRMLQDTIPVFVPEKFDENGKWMDGNLVGVVKEVTTGASLVWVNRV